MVGCPMRVDQLLRTLMCMRAPKVGPLPTHLNMLFMVSQSICLRDICAWIYSQVKRDQILIYTVICSVPMNIYTQQWQQ